jgi:hypothetical protein
MPKINNHPNHRESMLTGLEPALAKTASSSVARVAAPIGGRLAAAWRRRQIRRELSSGASANEASEFIRTLDPETASQLVQFATSVEIKSLAMNLATDNLIGSLGRHGNKINNDLKAQLKSLLRLNTSLREDDLGPATEIVFAALSKAISSVTSEISGDLSSLPPAAKASILKVQESYIDSAIRNSALLSGIGDLGSYRSFEDEYRSQVRNLYGTMRLPHAGTTKRVPYDKLYVQPRVRPISDETAAAAVRPEDASAIEELAIDTLRIVLLGDPGGGKSTLSLKMTFDCASSDSGEEGQASVPFLVVLREYAAEMSKNPISLLEYIEQQCNVTFSVMPPQGAIDYLLLNGRALVIFDGLDELLDTALRRRVVDAVTGFATRYPVAPIFVTSRRVGYSDAPLDPDLFAAFTLCEFSAEQVAQYANNWFNLDESIQPGRRHGLADSFLADSIFVNDLRVNPLMLSLMCGIYATENYIPRNRPDVYEKCALLLFDNWDRQRGIKASLPFDAHVQAAMRSLALWLYPQQASQQGLPREKLIDYMKQYLMKKRFDNEEEAENAATEFIDFCKGRAWVLTDIGSERYGYTHRTFLEYFAASQVVRENTDPSRLFDYLLERLQGGGWEVVAQLALQILNKSVEDGADDFLEILLAHTGSDIGTPLRYKLLEFAAQALTYIVPRPPVLQELVTQVVRYYGGDESRQQFANPLHQVLAASSENLPLVAKYLYDSVSRLLEEDAANQTALFIALYADAIAYRGAIQGGWQGGPRNLRYWEQQVKANVERFEAWIESRKEFDFSVALFQFEHGRCSARDMISWHGPEAIFAVPKESLLATIDTLPLAIRILLGFTRDNPSRSLARGTTVMTRDEIEALKNVLLDIPTFPWCELDEDDRVPGLTGFILTNFRSESMGMASFSAFLLLLMAIYDMSDGSDFDVRRRSRLRRELPDDRPRQELPDEAGISLAWRIIRTRDKLVPENRADGSIPGQASLFEELGADFFIRESLSSANIDERTAALIEHWIIDPLLLLVKVRWRQTKAEMGWKLQ